MSVVRLIPAEAAVHRCGQFFQQFPVQQGLTIFHNGILWNLLQIIITLNDDVVFDSVDDQMFRPHATWPGGLQRGSVFPL